MPKTIEKFKLNISENCLRFYVSGEFIVSSTKFNFVILLIKSIFSYNKTVSIDQVFFIRFSAKVSKT